MFRLVIKIVVLLAVLFAFILFFCRFDTRQEIKDSNVMHLLAAEADHEALDFLFIGPSYVYDGVIPQMFDSAGYKSFNLGIATSGPYFNELVLDNYLRQSKKPSCICIALAYTSMSDMASDVWGLYPIHRYLAPPVSNEAVFLKYASLTDYFKMTRNSFKKGFKNFFTGRTDVDTVLLNKVKASKGYNKTEEVTTAQKMEMERKIFMPYMQSTFSKRKEEKMFFLADKYLKMGIRIVFFQPPTFKLGDYFNPSFKDRYAGFIKKLKNKNWPVIDMPVTGFDSTCFVNTDHMNYKGAGLYSRYLISKLVHQ